MFVSVYSFGCVVAVAVVGCGMVDGLAEVVSTVAPVPNWLHNNTWYSNW